MSHVNICKELADKLRTETSLLSLLGSDANKIFRTPLPGVVVPPCVGFTIMGSTALDKSITVWKKYLIKISGYALTEVAAMKLGDAVQQLFDDRSGTNRSYYDFSGELALVKSTRWQRRLLAQYHEDENEPYWENGNLIEIVANPYLGI